jgi:hypothetical protein
MKGVVPKQPNIHYESSNFLNIHKLAKNGQAPWNIIKKMLEGTALHDSAGCIKEEKQNS